MNMPDFRFIAKYLNYKLFARHKHGHGIHSPFVYNLIREAIEADATNSRIDAIECLRKQLKNDKTKIQVQDLGAGSKKMATAERSIAQIARYVLTSPKYAGLLYRLSTYFDVKNVLEMGTSLGLATAYLAVASPYGKMITLEGCPHISAVAKDNFRQLKLKNIELLQGDFSDTLPQALERFEQLDLVFFDGNHQKQPTIDYFEACLPKIRNHTLFVFDDIHWSKGMEEAWNTIKAHPQTRVSIDLFEFGLVFFRKELTRQHFRIRF